MKEFSLPYVKKLIIILQRLKDSEQLIWNITGFSGFNLLRMHIAMDKTFLLNEKKSMLDMMKIEKGSGQDQRSCSGSKSPGSASKTDDRDSATYVG